MVSCKEVNGDREEPVEISVLISSVDTCVVIMSVDGAKEISSVVKNYSKKRSILVY